MGSFDSLRYRDYRLLWIGAVLSNSGTWMANVAVAWYVLELTRSPFWVSFVTFISFLPTVLSPIGGVYTDRLDRKSILLYAQAFMMVDAVALTVLAWTGRANLFAVMALIFGQGIGFALNGPAWMALVPSLVPPEAMVNAIALNSAQFNLARVIGPAITGPLIAASGVTLVFGINAVSFLAVLAALAAMKRSPVPDQAGRTVKELLLGGFAYTWGHRPIRLLIAVVAVISFFAAPMTSLLPVFTSEVYGRGAAGYGALAAALGVGSVLGALALGRVGDRAAPRSIALVLVGVAALMVLFAAIPVYAAGAGLLLLYGGAFLFIVAATNSAIQLQVEEKVRGRVLSIWMFAFGACFPAGSLLAGLAAEAWGARATTVAGAVVCALWGAGMLLRTRASAA